MCHDSAGNLKRITFSIERRKKRKANIRRIKGLPLKNSTHPYRNTVIFPLYHRQPKTIFLMLALDLGVFHKEAHEVKVKEALGWSAVWIALGLSFSFSTGHYDPQGNKIPSCFAEEPELFAYEGRYRLSYRAPGAQSRWCLRA